MCVSLLMVVTHLLDPDEAMEVSEMLIYELAMKQSTTQEHFSRLLCLYIIISVKLLHPLSHIFTFTDSTYIFPFQAMKTF